jgi:hypothetical protein
MDTISLQDNQLHMQVTDIQYIPYHRCPQCGAQPRTTETGIWIRPYQDWFGTPLSRWLDHLGYVYFQCNCQHHAQFQGAQRVAHLGEAIVPIHFDDGTLAHQVGLEAATLNAERVRRAVTFLAQYADPAFTAGNDWLLQELCSLAAGGISPEAARRELKQWIEHQLYQQNSPATGDTISNSETMN